LRAPQPEFGVLHGAGQSGLLYVRKETISGELFKKRRKKKYKDKAICVAKCQIPRRKKKQICDKHTIQFSYDINLNLNSQRTGR